MKKIVLCLLAFVLLGIFLIGCNSGGKLMNNKTEIETSTNEVETETKAAETETKVTETETKSELSDKVEIKIKNYDGVIKLELDKNKAPITVDNFLSLVNNKFYDGLTFHRIIPGFMIQGGDPLGNGMGGSEKSIKGEFSSNGVNNDISHKRGVISMARSMDPNSASSQFFIVHQDSLFLDGNYAAFGYVTEGMDIVDKICEDIEPKIQDDNGTVLKEDQPVIEYIKIIK